MFPLQTRILIVDDLASIRDVVKAYMRRLGYKNIEDAENGKQAYEAFLRAKVDGQPYGLILSDWNMPEMTGVEFLKQVRSSPSQEAHTPFLLMTTESEKEKVIEAIKAGVNNYLVKPVEESVLKEKLEGVWNKLHAR